jgi:hypothetical protein
MTDDLERYLYHSHQGWPVYGTQTPTSLTGEAMTELGTYMYVLLSDARTAINDAENLAYERGVKAGFAAVKQAEEDMLRRCEEAAYTDLLALEDDMREAFGKGSDAARIVAGYRSAMPSFRQFCKEKP